MSPPFTLTLPLQLAGNNAIMSHFSLSISRRCKQLLLLCSVMTLGACASAPPVDGRLVPCPSAPHCVSSEAELSSSHYVAPLALHGRELATTKQQLQSVIEQMGGEISHNSNTYLSATFSSAIFSFTDDLECRIDVDAGVVQVRSASRLGYYDMGANRRRVETLRAGFEAALNQ
jgi:uncharacterized protein (DUF1499 family)